MIIARTTKKKYWITWLLVALAILIIALPAFAIDKREKKQFDYEFPPEMAQAVREQFIRECDKGQALYELSCAKCHNGTDKGKTVIPDWTSAQLVGYELRVLNPKHESGIPEEQISAEELGYIMTFLTYRKKNIAPVK